MFIINTAVSTKIQILEAFEKTNQISIRLFFSAADRSVSGILHTSKKYILKTK